MYGFRVAHIKIKYVHQSNVFYLDDQLSMNLNYYFYTRVLMNVVSYIVTHMAGIRAGIEKFFREIKRVKTVSFSIIAFYRIQIKYFLQIKKRHSIHNNFNNHIIYSTFILCIMIGILVWYHLTR